MTDPNTPNEPLEQKALDDVLQGLSTEGAEEQQSLDDILASLEEESQADSASAADRPETDDVWNLDEDEVASSGPIDPDLSDLPAETAFELDANDELAAVFETPESTAQNPFESPPPIDSEALEELPQGIDSQLIEPEPWSTPAASSEPFFAASAEEPNAMEESTEAGFEMPTSNMDEALLDAPPSPLDADPWMAAADPDPSLAENAVPAANPFAPVAEGDEVSSFVDESSFVEEIEAGVETPDSIETSEDSPAPVDSMAEPWAAPSTPTGADVSDSVDAPFAAIAQSEDIEPPREIESPVNDEPVETVFGTTAYPDSGDAASSAFAIEEDASSEVADSDSGAWGSSELSSDEPFVTEDPAAFTESEQAVPDASEPVMPFDSAAPAEIPAVSEEMLAAETVTPFDFADAGSDSPEMGVSSFSEPSAEPLDRGDPGDRSFSPPSEEPTLEPAAASAPLEDLELNDSEPDFSGPELPDLPPLIQPSSISQASIDAPSGNKLEPLEEPLTLSNLLDRPGGRWMLPLGLILILGVIGVIVFVSVQGDSGDDTEEIQESRRQPSIERVARLLR
jgi:hypothetical protein